jgi:protein-disulfide isomerase/uncharacterized membrane protein
MTTKRTIAGQRAGVSEMETAGHASASATTAPSFVGLVAGAIFVGVSALMSLLLVLEHLGGTSLPGCGAGSACAQAANSVWGRIKLGGFVWPVSYLGLAYFLAALTTWVATRAVVPHVFRYLVRVGALVSLGYCALIVVKWIVCPYCIIAHVCNFAFWIVVESVAIRPARRRRAAVTLGGAFAVVTLALGLWDAQHRAAVRAQAEQERGVAAQQIIDRSKQNTPAPATSPATTAANTPAPTSQNRTASEAAATKSQPPGAPPPSTTPPVAHVKPPMHPPSSGTVEPMFTGRYRVGPAEAPIRIVMFTDYQCRDCYNMEKQLKKLHDTRSDISISIKHFPFNKECNPYMSKTIHQNSCWAARAAEAAGKLWGAEGFWKMHVWLFDRKGMFETTEQLETGIREMGYDPTGFVQVMSSEETLKAVETDAAEAKRLGLHFTPMIFVNGVELKGWFAPNALIRTVEQVAAADPPARSAAFDRPPSAFEKYIADWREQPLLTLPPDQQAWTFGPDGAKVTIVLWGDYQEAGCTQADAIIRAFAADRADVQYTYRHYPFNGDCNPNLKKRRFPNSCRAAQAAEAAGRLGGNDGYWKMHAWLMENRERFSESTLRAAATQMGLDTAALLDAMDQPDLQASILDDIQAGKKLPQLRHGVRAGLYGIPTIFVNGRYVPRWRLDKELVLKEILLEAANDSPGGTGP